MSKNSRPPSKATAHFPEEPDVSGSTALRPEIGRGDGAVGIAINQTEPGFRAIRELLPRHLAIAVAFVERQLHAFLHPPHSAAIPVLRHVVCPGFVEHGVFLGIQLAVLITVECEEDVTAAFLRFAEGG